MAEPENEASIRSQNSEALEELCPKAKGENA